MRILLRRLLSASTLTALFFAGCLTGYYFSPQLQRCQAQNKMLSEDLAYAVARGVTLETSLILCRENKK